MRSRPENTLAAIRLAWRQGADGKVLCIHDETTKRTADKSLTVTKSTLAELRTLGLGAWKSPEFKGARIPALSEVHEEIS